MENTSWLAGMFSNPVADAVLIVGIIALVITLAILGKKGLLSLTVKGVSIGNGEQERTIVRNQIDYAKAAVDTFVSTLPEKDETKYLKRYIGELVFDVFVECISYNHINKTSFYIDNKIDKIWSIIVKYSKTEDYKTQDFKSKVSADVRNVFEHLVDIREYYNKEK